MTNTQTLTLAPTAVKVDDFLLDGFMQIRVDRVRPSKRYPGHTDLFLCDGQVQSWPNEAEVVVKRREA